VAYRRSKVASQQQKGGYKLI